ncbi:MAG: hypothetical protein LBE78_00990 [Burkholderiaceae bacterium]|jgi:hypothetical protein|nr:hypothetical protein [Burkholderiaceae bacterium]
MALDYPEMKLAPTPNVSSRRFFSFSLWGKQGWGLTAQKNKRRAGFTPPLRRFTKPGDGGVNPNTGHLSAQTDECRHSRLRGNDEIKVHVVN